MIVVVKIGTSSITDDDGPSSTPTAVAKLCAEVADLRAGRSPRRDRHLGRHRRGAAGHRVHGRASQGRRHAAGGVGHRPDPPDAGLRAGAGRPRPRRRARCSSPRSTSSCASSTSTPAPRSSACSSSASCPVVNENDAIADDEIRFGDNDRLAALVAHLVSADLLVLLTDAPGLLTADPRLDSSRLADRGDRRGRPRARGAGRRLRHGAGQRRHGLEAGRREDRRVVGRAGRDRPGLAARRAGRRGRRRGRRRHRGPPEAAPPVGPQALDRVRRRLERHGSRSTTAPATALLERGVSLLPAGVRTVRGPLRPRRRRRARRPRRRGVRQGPRAARAAGAAAAASPVGAPATCPKASPTRSIHRDDLVVVPR